MACTASGEGRRLPLPSPSAELFEELLGVSDEHRQALLGAPITDKEVELMANSRPGLLTNAAPSAADLEKDYGAAEARAIMACVNEAIGTSSQKGLFLGALHVPGVATRRQAYAAWVKRQVDAATTFVSSCNVLQAFATHVGRIVVYRALALDEAQLANIRSSNEIFPTGQLHTSASALQNILAEHGVRKVCVARLFIAQLKKMIGFDPSVSLHDDWQTTTSIASGYLGTPGKKVYLFEVVVPAVESVGLRLSEVAHHAPEFLGPRYASHANWFNFQCPAVPDGIWFDSSLQRTERYGLGAVKLLSDRLTRLVAFDSADKIGEAVEPFRVACAADHKSFPNGEGRPPFEASEAV